MCLNGWQDLGNAWNGSHQTTNTDTQGAEGWRENENASQDVAAIQLGPEAETDGWLLTSGAIWRARTWQARYNERATLTRIEPFTDTEPRLAENTHGQEQGNCGRFWCAYNFKVVGWISTGKYLKSMYGIGLTCGVDAALIQEVFRNSGISEQSLDGRIFMT